MIRKGILLGGAVLMLGAGSAFAFPPIDLTFDGASYLSASDGTFWKQNVTQPTGTGIYDPFLRVRANGTEEGMNTDAFPEILDNVGGGDPHTHSLQLNTLAITNIDLGNGLTDYYRFTLDINEPNGNGQNLISLDEIRIRTVGVGAGGSLTSEAAVTGAGGVLRYDMDAVVDQDVYLDHDITEGSGHDDMELWIPASFFAGASGTDFVYFYSEFGTTGGAFMADFDSGDGFEEWAADRSFTPPNQVPEPGMVALFGSGLLGLAAIRIRRK